MIDLHSHILANIDDGAVSSQESIKLLSESYSQGITVCVATPHATIHNTGDIDTFLSTRNTCADFLKNKLSQTNVKIPKLLYGAEVWLDNDVSEFENIKSLCIEGTNLMVVELPVTTYSPSYSDWLYSLSVKGISLILAHVERYDYFDELKNDLEGTNITYQINADTLLSFRGRRFVKELYRMENNIVVSSDVHGLTRRKNHMREAYDKISKRSKIMADELFTTNAAWLLQNKKNMG